MTEANPIQSPAPPPLPAVNPFAPPVTQSPALQARSSVSEEDKSLAMLCHLLAIFTGFLGPLILWLVKKDSSPFVSHHGRESVNFQITLMLVMMAILSVTFVLMFLLVGIFLVPLFFVVPLLGLIAEILAAVAAQKGEWHRYPCCIRLV